MPTQNLGSTDLKTWQKVPKTEGKSIGDIIQFRGSVWIAADDHLIEYKGLVAVRDIRLPGKKIVRLASTKQALVVSTVFAGEPPPEYCEPFLVSDGIYLVDVRTGLPIRIEVAGKPPEQALVQSVPSVRPGNSDLVFSDGMFSNSSYRFNDSSHELTLSSISLNRQYPELWLHSADFPLKESDLAPILEKALTVAGHIEFRILESLLGWLDSERNRSRMRRIYLGSPENRKNTLEILRRRNSPALLELLTLAVERRDYFEEELPRIIGFFHGVAYERLLLRLLRDSASNLPTSQSSYGGTAAMAAKFLLEVSRDKFAPAIEDVIELESTPLAVKRALEHEMGGGSRRIQRASVARGTEAVALLSDPDSNIRLTAIQSVADIPDFIPFEKLRTLVEDPDDEGVAAFAIRALVISSNSAAPNALVSAIHDKRPFVRGYALQGLAMRRDPRAFELLIAALEDELPRVRRDAILGLALLRDKRAIPALLKLAETSDGSPIPLAVEALSALEKIGDNSVVEALRKLKTDNPRIQSSIDSAIRKLEAKPKG